MTQNDLMSELKQQALVDIKRSKRCASVTRSKGKIFR